MIGLFPRRDAAKREMDALDVVILEPLLAGSPCSLRILIIFVVDRAVDPLHLAVPPRRLFRDEEMRQVPSFAPRMEIPAELAPVVGLD